MTSIRRINSAGRYVAICAIIATVILIATSLFGCELG